MVECSPTLQKLQHKNLKCVDEDSHNGNVDKRTISMLTGTPVSWHAALEQVPSGCMEIFFLSHVLTNPLCAWAIFLSHNLHLFALFPVPTIIIAHEFYDALPVHQFQVRLINLNKLFDDWVLVLTVLLLIMIFDFFLIFHWPNQKWIIHFENPLNLLINVWAFCQNPLTCLIKFWNSESSILFPIIICSAL